MLEAANHQTVLVTGAAGFIGARVVERLLARGVEVVGVDNVNDYYDCRLKRHRLASVAQQPGFRFHEMDIEDRAALRSLFAEQRFDAVLNLAARAGVRYSVENPHVYFTTNVLGNLNLLECMRESGVKKLVLASSSSLYAGQATPFTEDLPVNEPISPYAASKKAAEITAYTYHHLFGLDVSVLRFFTVYGPAGRPDMAIFRFIRWIAGGRPVRLYGGGQQTRDFTYVDDIAEGVVAALVPVGFEIVNLGGGLAPASINDVIGRLETLLGKRAVVERLPAHVADLSETWADIRKARRLFGWQPQVSLDAGLKATVDWFLANRELAESIAID